MKGQELKLMREFKEKSKELTNFVMTDLNDELSEFLDIECNKYLLKTQELYKNVTDVINKINTMEDIKEYINKYNETVNSISEVAEEINSFFCNDDKSDKSITKLIMDKNISKIKPYSDELNELIIIASLMGCQKTSNNLKFQFKKLIDEITCLINEIADQVINPYKKEINNTYLQTCELVKNKQKELMEWLEDNDKDNKKNKSKDKKFKKVFKCKDMNYILEQTGYEPIRQSGSHKIYSDGIKNISVPQHTVFNKCLGYGIQKQITR